tara:strand:+ start:510 stop:701 length:192 start_codon:yes stop_codon:yes gene_type:complete
MMGMVYVRVLEMSSQSYGEDYMFKKFIKWVMVVSIEAVGWLMWPVAKAHQKLKELSAWLHKKM